MVHLKTSVLHPFLIAVYAVLALYAHNIEELQFTNAVRPLIVSLFAASLLLLALRALLKDWHKAALITSLALILFFSYGHVYNGLRPLLPAGALLIRHRLLAPLWLSAFTLGTWWINQRIKDLHLPNQALNVIAIVALVFPLLQAGSFFISDLSSASTQPQATVLDSPSSSRKPDIYYIILDAYGRDDTLMQLFSFDNTPFLDKLAGMGFYVARCSQSNYAQTQLSLSSSLNLNYLQTIDEKYSGKTGNNKRTGLPRMIKRSAARQFLEGLGYTTIAFETGFHWTEFTDADIYLTRNNAHMAQLSMIGGITDFETLLLKTSAGLLIADGAVSLPESFHAYLDNPEKEHRERVLFILDKLGELPARPGPKFVFAHIVSPHPPFVFSPDGEFSHKNNEDMSGYVDQIGYLNNRLEQVLAKIIAESQSPPVIIVQADHGMLLSSPKTRVSILSAYYLPDGGDRLLYESISPVNTFRLIFDYYLGRDYNLLEDVTYYSNYLHPFEFRVVPETRPGCP
jgi:hypothetical protein